jgi:hypothetical protein
MAWFVHYWDEINNRNICSSEISARQDAMRKACSLMREGYVVSHVAGPNGERLDIVDIRAWCSAHASNYSAKPLALSHIWRVKTTLRRLICRTPALNEHSLKRWSFGLH